LGDQLTYIIRGLGNPQDQQVAEVLAEYLEQCRSSRETASADKVLELLDAASQLMVSRPEYDHGDFDHEQIYASLDALVDGDKEVWGELLHALDDIKSPVFMRLKVLSPYAEFYLMFIEAVDHIADVRAELDDAFAARVFAEADVQIFPGNCVLVGLPFEAMALMKFIPAPGYKPATV